MDLERLDAIAFEHGPADAFHAGSDFLDGHDRRDGARGPDRGRGEKKRDERATYRHRDVGPVLLTFVGTKPVGSVDRL